MDGIGVLPPPVPWTMTVPKPKMRSAIPWLMLK